MTSNLGSRSCSSDFGFIKEEDENRELNVMSYVKNSINQNFLTELMI